MCYTEKARNSWHRRGTQKTGNPYSQPKRPSTDTTHRPSTLHYRKGSPGVKTQNTNIKISTEAVHAFSTETTRHHYPHLIYIYIYTQLGHHQILSANAARCEAQAG